MILRLVVLCASGAGAYLLLKGQPSALPVMLRACLAVLLLVGGLGWWAVRKYSDDIVTVRGKRKPGWADFLAIGMALLALECGFLWLLSAAPGPLEMAATAIEAKISANSAAAREEVEGEEDVSGNWLWNDQRQRALPRRTNLKPGVKPEVFVRLPRKLDAERLLRRQVYVRAFVLDEFRDGVWSLGKTSDESLSAGEDGWIRFRNDGAEGILHEVFHANDRGERNVVTALQGVDAVRVPTLQKVKDGLWFLPDRISKSTGFEYLASSQPLTLDELKGRSVAAGEVPIRSTGRLGRFSVLAEKAAGRGTLLERLLHIQEFMRTQYSYSLVTENPGNIDALENFLFVEKRGHCEFFATAAALMARELGVETRVAYGWAGGQFFKDSQMFVFRAREAHSWVEVKLEGYGWVAMEPTPPVVLGGGGTPRIAAAGEKMPSPAESPANGDAAAVIAGEAQVKKMALALAGAFGGCAGLFLVMRTRKRGDPFFPKTAENSRESGYFLTWQRAAERHFGNRTTGMTLGQQLAALPEIPEFGSDLRKYHYGIRYEGKTADAEREEELRKQIQKWSELRDNA